jgi:hypothetical protein
MYTKRADGIPTFSLPTVCLFYLLSCVFDIQFMAVHFKDVEESKTEDVIACALPALVLSPSPIINIEMAVLPVAAAPYVTLLAPILAERLVVPLPNLPTLHWRDVRYFLSIN